MKSISIILMTVIPWVIGSNVVVGSHFEEKHQIESIRKYIDSGCYHQLGNLYEEDEKYSKLRINMIRHSLKRIFENLIDINQEIEIVEMMLGVDEND
jgi:hypothetical protein